MLSFLIVLAGVGYFVGGSAYSRRRHGSKRPWREELPHRGRWVHLHALVLDGVQFSKARLTGKGGVARPAHSREPLVGSAGATDGGGRRSSAPEGGEERTPSKLKGKATKSKDKGKSKKGKRSDSRGASSGKGGADASAPHSSGAVDAAEQAERELREERDASAHSSQQKIQVVTETMKSIV